MANAIESLCQNFLLAFKWIFDTDSEESVEVDHSFVVHLHSNVSKEDTFRVAAELGSESLGVYVISIASKASDILAMELLQKDARLAVSRELGGDCLKDIQNLVDCLSDDDDDEPSDLSLVNLGTTESAGRATGAGAANDRKELHDLNTNNNKINGVITAEESSRQSSLVKTKDKRSKVSVQGGWFWKRWN